MRKILLSSTVMMSVLAVVAVGGTAAFFSDSEVSNGNLFTASTLDLQVGDVDPAEWNFIIDDVKPGDSGTESVTVTNTGAMDGFLHSTFSSLVNSDVDCVEPELDQDDDCAAVGDSGADGELADGLEVVISLDRGGVFTTVYDGSVRGILQGDEFNYPLAAGESVTFVIDWSADSEMGNEAQTDQAGFDAVFELNQVQNEVVGDWHFNEGTGATAVDSSGAGNDGVMTGATWVDGQYNDALVFDGNDIVEIANPDDYDQLLWTYEFWFSASSSANYPNLIGRQFGNGDGWTVHLSPQGWLKIRIDTDTHTNQLVSVTNNYRDNEWYHGAVVFDDSAKTVWLYVDGNLEKTGSYAGDFVPSGGSLKMGAPTVGAHYYSGILDEVKIYGRALSAAEINDNYNKGAE